MPLHPQLKELLDAGLAARPAELRSPFLWVERGRRVSRRRVAAALDEVAAAAGVARVTPHQLRHTLATQAIDRGMSLEALAALLGHKSLSMTLVYARIADRTVAEEYFAVSERVEALYDRPKELPAGAEVAEMAELRREADRRTLGNGYCARPVELDCHFESICESCTHFVTTVEFRPTLQRQRDDAAAKGQVGRSRVFEGVWPAWTKRRADRWWASPTPPLLVVVSGLPATGRSTIAEAVAAELRAPVFSVDPLEATLWRAGIGPAQRSGYAPSGRAEQEVPAAVRTSSAARRRSAGGRPCRRPGRGGR